MSVKVISAVMSHSEARLGARLVLLAIADNAEDGSGIAYPPIVDREDTPEHRRKSIAFKTRLSEREVRLSLRELERLGEIEIQQAQRGRGRINVYRVLVGYLGEREPQVGDLPFELLKPFSTTGSLYRQSDSGDEHPARSRPFPTEETTTGKVCRQSDAGLPAIHDRDYRQSGPSTTGTLRARVEEPGPSEGPSSEPDGERVDRANTLALALTVALGAKQLTRSERANWQDAIEQLVDVDATAQEIAERCVTYRRIFPEAALTPKALVNQWNLLGARATTAQSDPAASLDGWVEKTGWQMDPEDARLHLEGTGFSPERIEEAVARVAELRAQHAAGAAATEEVLRGKRAA